MTLEFDTWHLHGQCHQVYLRNVKIISSCPFICSCFSKRLRMIFFFFFFQKSLWMKRGQTRCSKSIGHRLQAGEMKIIRTFIIFNSTVRSDEAQHRCYGGLPITVQPYFSLLLPSSPTTPQVIIEEQRAAICPCLLSAPCGCACLCVHVYVCVL